MYGRFLINRANDSAMTSHITISAIQQPCNGDRQANLDISIEQISAAAEAGAELVVLPELHLHSYFCQSEDSSKFQLAESIPGATTKILAGLADLLNIVIVASLFEKRAPGLYHNTAVVFDRDGSIAGRYRKMHIPDDPGYYEKYYFTPGDLGFTPIDTSIGRLGVLVCWDQWFPEAARLMALAGADILIYPTAIGWDPRDGGEEKNRQLDAWLTIQRAHAIANGIPVLACNRTGLEASPCGQSGIAFWGNSFIAGPQGEFLQRADSQESRLLLCDIDGKQSAAIRQSWPYLRDRRIDSYQGLNSLYID